MSFKEKNFTDRRTTATDAKKAALEKFRQNTATNDAKFNERQEQLKATRLAREKRAAEREVTRRT